MSSVGAASRAAPMSNARAEASRRNGVRSRGPKTPEGKARSAQNALKHGLRAQKYVVLPDEDGAAFQVLEAALMEELAPQGALQTVLAQRVVAATWRLERAERLEADLFAENHLADGSLGLALIRDCNRARAFDTLVRYRGGTLAEFWRALRTLKALQAERAAQPGMQAPAPARQLAIEPNAGRSGCIELAKALPRKNPIEPESRAYPSESEAESSNDPARRPRAAPAPASEPQYPPSRSHACSTIPSQTNPRSDRDALAVPPRPVPHTEDLPEGPGACLLRR